MFRPKFPSSTRKWYNFRRKSMFFLPACFFISLWVIAAKSLLWKNNKNFFESTFDFWFLSSLVSVSCWLESKTRPKENITTTNLPHEVKSWILQCWNHTRILMRTRVECKLGYFWVFRSWTRIPRFGKCNFFFSPSPSQTRSAHKKSPIFCPSSW